MWFLFYVGILSDICSGHISMSSPPSRRNQLSSYYNKPGLVNYNLRSPLNANPDWFTFPCKGFPKGPSVATFNTNKISVTLEGTAVHGGGHCQFGVSYDDKTFYVLHTVVGDCLLRGMTYEFDVPRINNSSDVTIFWTWINRIGNREYYMECTDITLNTPITNKIVAKELLIVNLPGYPRVPEWEPGASSNIDGRDLLNRRRDIIFETNPKPTLTSKPPPKPTSLSKPTPKPKVRKITKVRKIKRVRKPKLRKIIRVRKPKLRKIIRVVVGKGRE